MNGTFVLQFVEMIVFPPLSRSRGGTDSETGSRSVRQAACRHASVSASVVGQLNAKWSPTALKTTSRVLNLTADLHKETFYIL